MNWTASIILNWDSNIQSIPLAQLPAKVLFSAQVCVESESSLVSGSVNKWQCSPPTSDPCVSSVSGSFLNSQSKLLLFQKTSQDGSIEPFRIMMAAQGLSLCLEIRSAGYLVVFMLHSITAVFSVLIYLIYFPSSCFGMNFKTDTANRIYEGSVIHCLCLYIWSLLSVWETHCWFFFKDNLTKNISFVACRFNTWSNISRSDLIN